MSLTLSLFKFVLIRLIQFPCWSYVYCVDICATVSFPEIVKDKTGSPEELLWKISRPRNDNLPEVDPPDSSVIVLSGESPFE
jgi:hypothetical protein